ncbi:hypothetical protein QQF64_014263 [Cirrhinus molitorella]|uniref:Uncharacterized protein n=1 Tax=Cirrhinus molitorella TaxID=172907 RepID=A0ABR3NRK5_9TELE
MEKLLKAAEEKKSEREMALYRSEVTTLKNSDGIQIILNWLSQHLDEQQPREQAGFRKNYSTMDHIFTQLLERAREYRLQGGVNINGELLSCALLTMSCSSPRPRISCRTC